MRKESIGFGFFLFCVFLFISNAFLTTQFRSRYSFQNDSATQSQCLCFDWLCETHDKNPSHQQER